MRLALRLARKGLGNVSPNPLVGAVVVKNGRIIGQGFHERFGSDHAEVNALREAGDDAGGATLVVTLEPCSHHGKTPPCTEQIIAAGIKRVVVAMPDPNPLVDGSGLLQLQTHGIQVESGILHEEARQMNAPFVKFITRKLPYVTLKIAQTLDAQIADGAGASRWITGETARRLVHRWRWHAGAVLVGIGTVLADDPQLTVRQVGGKQPWRLILDSRLRIPLHAKLLNDSYVERTVVLALDVPENQRNATEIERRGARVVQVQPSATGEMSLSEVLHEIARMNIAHIFVEGGHKVFSAFVREQAADHLALFIAARMFGAGVPALTFPGRTAQHPLSFARSRWRRIDADMLFEGDFVWG